ncbi:MAG: DUF2953 domain-containing protein [Bacillota bacterium]|jgi:hypothetical protein|nr:DUF2953 domain-containing protein [Candidatus Fermentithermobacillaceae bacterium]HAF67274.1 hypothetical protein [Clostridiales bacterium UBA9857]HOA70857.1 DUF2953 domain-containing protein [Bacillota bacterium]HPT36209.1 DUF2953 domain-containing protein [Bacillota bacterium]HPZ85219.1 DUF2953 domain-containing protein [Bacillota bacterium]
MIILIVALKCILWAVIVVFSAVLIGLALPVSVKASGWLSVEDNFEEASCKLDEGCLGDVALFLYDGTFTLSCRAFLGLISAQVGHLAAPEVRVAGIKVQLGSGRAPGKSQGPTKDQTPGRAQPDQPKKTGDKSKGKKIDFDEIRKYLSPAVRTGLIDTLKALYKAFHLDADLDVELGLSDPAHTGMVFGLFSAVAGWTGISGVRLHPNFHDRGLLVQGSISMWTVPLHVLWIGVRFMLVPEIRQLWWNKRKQGGA